MEFAPWIIIGFGLIVCIGTVVVGERLGPRQFQLAMLGLGASLVAFGLFAA